MVATFFDAGDLSSIPLNDLPLKEIRGRRFCNCDSYYTFRC
jgi:hypothetical protein